MNAVVKKDICVGNGTCISNNKYNIKLMKYVLTIYKININQGYMETNLMVINLNELNSL